MAERKSQDSAVVAPGSGLGIQQTILVIRGERVILDRHLAALYGVETRVLVQAVKRNIRRFPTDFMFQLTKIELENWRSQIVISNPSGKMGVRRQPYAFTEHGVAMVSSVIGSDQAIEVNIEIMRAFSKLRRILNTNKDLAVKLNELESKYDKQFKVVFDAIRNLMEPAQQSSTRQIGLNRN